MEPIRISILSVNVMYFAVYLCMYKYVPHVHIRMYLDGDESHRTHHPTIGTNHSPCAPARTLAAQHFNDACDLLS